MPQNNYSPERIVHRKNGGWIALSGLADSLKIGVTASTEREAREKFAAAVTAWHRALSHEGGHASCV